MDWNVPVSRSNGAPLLNTTSSPEIAQHCSKFHRSLPCKRDNDEIRFVKYDNTIISISSFHNAVWLYWYSGYVSIWEPIKHITPLNAGRNMWKKPVLLLPRPIESAGDQPVTCNNSPVSTKICFLTSRGISIMKIRRSHHSLIIIMKIPIPGRWSLYWVRSQFLVHCCKNIMSPARWSLAAII